VTNLTFRNLVIRCYRNQTQAKKIFVQPQYFYATSNNIITSAKCMCFYKTYYQISLQRRN